MPLFIDVFYYLLLFWLHPSIVSSFLYPQYSAPPFSYCFPLWLLPWLSSLPPPSLCVYLQGLWDSVSGSCPLITTDLQLTCMTGRSGLRCPTPSKQGTENDLLCIFGKGSPTHTQPIALHPKHRVADSYHLHKLPKCGRGYFRKWWWPVVPSPQFLPLTCLTFLLPGRSFATICWSNL